MTADGFATFAATREEALRQFQRQNVHTCHSSEPDDSTDAVLEGMALSLAHHSVGSRGTAERTAPGEMRHALDVEPPERVRR